MSSTNSSGHTKLRYADDRTFEYVFSGVGFQQFLTQDSDLTFDLVEEGKEHMKREKRRRQRMEESASRKRDFNSRFGDPESRSGGKLYDLIESHLYSTERARMYPIQGHFQRPHGLLPHLGPGFRGPHPDTFLRIRDYKLRITERMTPVPFLPPSSL